jgi:hypothetical protein
MMSNPRSTVRNSAHISYTVDDTTIDDTTVDIDFDNLFNNKNKKEKKHDVSKSSNFSKERKSGESNDTQDVDITVENPTKLNRRELAKYTSKDRDVKSMNDDEFLNYTSFLVKQQDVHSSEKARDAYDTTKNYKNIKTFKQFMKAISTILIVLLIFALVVLLIFAIVYLIIYFRRDRVKMVIDFIMLGSALCFIGIFLLYLYLFMKMTGTIKKIMSLL